MKKLLFTGLLLIILLSGCAAKQVSEFQQLKDEASRFNYWGVDSTANGEYERGLSFLQHALHLNLKADNQKGIAINLLNIGRLYLIANKPEDAREVFIKAKKIGEKIDDNLVISESYGSLARCYYQMGRYNEALDTINKGIEFDKAKNPQALGNKLNILGMLYLRDNKIKEADATLNEALGKGKDGDKAESMRLLGDIAITNNDLSKAKELNETALEIDKRVAIVKASEDIYNLGVISMKLKDYEAAADYFQRGYEIDNNRNNMTGVLKSLDKLIELSKLQKDDKAAAAYSKEKENILKTYLSPLSEAKK